MTPYSVERLPFERDTVSAWGQLDRRHRNWPVVYLLDNPGSSQASDVYVGESLNAASRLRQHLDSSTKQHLSSIRVILDDTFNKSVCLDLESFLIRMLSGDGVHRVLNRNDGITEADYFERASYQKVFQDVFDELRAEGIFTRSAPEIRNTPLFKFSPFKALEQDQAAAVEDIVEGLLEDLSSGAESTIVVQGDPGTGKTVVAIYLLKLLADISMAVPVDDFDADTMFAEFFTEENRALLAQARIGLVVPQQSLRQSIKKVFRATPGLQPKQVITAFEAAAAEPFDLLIVDETHRLNHRANQPAASLNTKFQQLNLKHFGHDDPAYTQLDWIRANSKHQIFLVDAAQSVRPADLPSRHLESLMDDARSKHRLYPLTSQMRVRAGEDYVRFIRDLLAGKVPDSAATSFEGYDLRMFDSIELMQSEIRQRDAEVGLSRLVAGYAWKWVSKKNPSAFDIELDGVKLRWNVSDTDWIASATSIDEVGSIHTVQGYDLNYAGVIIGPDLRFDEARGIYFDRASYFDKKGMQNNPKRGITYSDEDVLVYIRNIYAVLLTRGILGTYIYVVDPALREYLRSRLPLST